MSFSGGINVSFFRSQYSDDGVFCESEISENRRDYDKNPEYDASRVRVSSLTKSPKSLHKKYNINIKNSNSFMEMYYPSG